MTAFSFLFRQPHANHEMAKNMAEIIILLVKEEITRMVAEKELLEHTKIHGNYYGTPRAPVETLLQQGRDILFDIDTPGVNQIAAFSRN